MAESHSRRTATQDIGFALAEPRAARRGFDRAAATFEEASFIHDRAREILCDRLDLLQPSPRVIVDLGSGLGAGADALRARFPASTLVAIDSSVEMCRRAAGRSRGAAVVVAEATRLPLGAARADLVFANLVLPWCRPEVVLAEIARVLAPDGLLLFSTFGPETLRELHEAWRQADGEIHVHAAFDAQAVGDWLAQAGLAEPVVDVDRLTLRYSSARKLHADLRAAGAANVAAGRRRTMTGPGRFHRYMKALEARAVDGRIGVTCELVFGAAWGRPPRDRARDGGREWQAVPVASITRRSLS